tara:strand:- start:194 stop:799 length:606 start_codon:yes stop_codon:yes gene_type:complete
VREILDIFTKKKIARVDAKLRRQEAYERIGSKASIKVADFFESFFQYDERSAGINVVAAYISIKTELNLQPTIARLLKIGKTICLPIIVNQNEPLIFNQWNGKSELTIGQFNVLIPTTGQKIEPDLIICPLLSYDEQGYRLGYGGGFYDRTIAGFEKQKRPIFAFGCGYAEQLSKEKLPVDQNDKKLNGMVTEKGLVFFGN